MKTNTLILAGAAGLLLCACIPSVYPFYLEKDTVNDPRLVGEWQERQNGEEKTKVWKFEATDDASYKLTLTDEQGKTGSFKAVLFQLESDTFLDLIPTDCDFGENQIDLVAASVFPGHLLIHVAQLEPELHLAFCDYEWLAKYLKRNPTALPHRKDDDNLLLTADTRALQRFVRSHLGEGELFPEHSHLGRKTHSAPAMPSTSESVSPETGRAAP